MIIAKRIFKSFGDAQILKGIDFTFERRKTNLIIGQSGAGKTVLLKILVGLVAPGSGEVWYDQINCMNLNKKEKRHLSMSVGMLFQGSALFDSMSVEENIRFPMDMFTNFTEGEKRSRVDYCLERVELTGVNKKYPSELSGGMQKRVGIARAIVLKPRYLFCDEPNSGLDPKTAIVIDDLIKDITVEEDMTTVINTHDMNSVMEIGDNILLLNKGQAEWTGSKEEILVSDNQYLADFIFASPFLKQLREMAIQSAR
jgi:phospholipid/cholesterol/gamma-HCH transport system ATP-binding protein